MKHLFENYRLIPLGVLVIETDFELSTFSIVVSDSVSFLITSFSSKDTSDEVVMVFYQLSIHLFIVYFQKIKIKHAILKKLENKKKIFYYLISYMCKRK